MKDKGFTLIELMIVIAIIAIIAAIAIPNLLEARLSANETSAAASLRAYLNAQGTYHRQDWDKDGVREYAADYSDLYELTDANGDTQTPHLIDQTFADADDDGDGATAPRSGYFFNDLTGYNAPTGDDAASGYADGFGLCGWPQTYGRSGRQVFIIDSSGTVYGQDKGDNSKENTWPASLTGWLPVSE